MQELDDRYLGVRDGMDVGAALVLHQHLLKLKEFHLLGQQQLAAVYAKLVLQVKVDVDVAVPRA